MEQNNQYIDKKQFILSIMLLVGLTITLFIGLFTLLNNKIEKISLKISDPTEIYIETSKTVEETDYLVKEFNGKIGVYLNGDFQYDLDIYVITLPEKDKQLLSEGIRASSEQELNEIISTYY